MNKTDSKLAETKVTIEALLEYEIMSSWWAGLIGFPWFYWVVGTYFAWKTKRKYAKYLYRLKQIQLVLANN